MAVQKIQKETFTEQVLKASKPVLVDFYADWCGPCKMVGPIVEQLSDEHSEYAFCKINVDESPELASQYNVMSIPTLMVFRDGKLAQQAVGARGKEAILDLLK